MSNDLRAALRTEANRLADEFYEKAMALLSAEVAGMFGNGRGLNGASALKIPAARRETIAPEEAEGILANVIETLQKHPGGLRLEGLRAELGLDRNTLGKAIRLGLESDQLTKSGQKRATTYRLPNAKKAKSR